MRSALLVKAAVAIAAHTLGPVQTVHGATAYSPCSSGSVMADGHRTYFGAVASNTLPMHTLLRFRRPIHGRRYFRVRDTGSSIMRLDVWLPDCGEAVRFGRRTIRFQVVRHPR